VAPGCRAKASPSINQRLALIDIRRPCQRRQALRVVRSYRRLSIIAAIAEIGRHRWIWPGSGDRALERCKTERPTGSDRMLEPAAGTASALAMSWGMPVSAGSDIVIDPAIIGDRMPRDFDPPELRPACGHGGRDCRAGHRGGFAGFGPIGQKRVSATRDCCTTRQRESFVRRVCAWRDKRGGRHVLHERLSRRWIILHREHEVLKNKASSGTPAGTTFCRVGQPLPRGEIRVKRHKGLLRIFAKCQKRAMIALAKVP